MNSEMSNEQIIAQLENEINDCPDCQGYGSYREGVEDWPSGTCAGLVDCKRCTELKRQIQELE